MKRPHHLVNALMALCVALLVFSCGGKGSRSSAAKAGQDTIDWNDSTFERYLILERFYNDEEHDSLLKHYPTVLEYCLAHLRHWNMHCSSWIPAIRINSPTARSRMPIRIIILDTTYHEGARFIMTLPLK